MENNLPIWEYWTIVVLILSFIAYYICMCVNTIVEGWHYNIKRFNRWNRSISGARDRVFDNDGNLIPGVNTQTFFWLWWGFEKKDGYQFHFVEGRDSTKVNLETDKQSILWNPTMGDALITYERDVWTTHHKDQHDYRFGLNGLETGKKIGAAKKTEPDIVENVKINTLLNSTVRMMNIYKAQYRAGGDADWYNSLYATIEGALGEVLGQTVYADLGLLRGERLQNILVKNTEPQSIGPALVTTPYFADAKGKRLKKITFLQRINYEMMIVKDLGMELINITMMGFEPDDESKDFVRAMQKQAISEVNVKTAQNEGIALGEILNVKETFIKNLITAEQAARIAIKNTKDATTEVKFTKLAESKITVYVDGQSGGSASDNNNLDVNKMIETAIGVDMSKKIDDTDGNN